MQTQLTPMTDYIRQQPDGYSGPDASRPRLVALSVRRPGQPSTDAEALDILTWALITAASMRAGVPVPTAETLPASSWPYFRALAARAIVTTNSGLMSRAKAEALQDLAEWNDGDVLSADSILARKAIDLYSAHLSQAAEQVQR